MQILSFIKKQEDGIFICTQVISMFTKTLPEKQMLPDTFSQNICIFVQSTFTLIINWLKSINCAKPVVMKIF